MRKFTISVAAATLVLSGAAMAQSTVGGGAAVSGPAGSVAGGATAGTANQIGQNMSDKAKKRHERRKSPRDERKETANSASTYGSGSIYTDRDRATGGVTAGGSASGTGSQSTSTAIDAYGSTTSQGSEAEVYGDSTANSTNPPQ